MEKRSTDALLHDQNQELSQFVNNIVRDMVCERITCVSWFIKQMRFDSMADSLLLRIDDMGDRIDELEKRYDRRILDPI
jgi:hypothetical protein